MKIIIIGSAYPYRGGTAIFNERLASEYAKQGNEVEVYTFTMKLPSLEKSSDGDRKMPQGIKIKRRVNILNPINWYRTGKYIAQQNVDLVIFSYWIPLVAPCYGTIAKYAYGHKTRFIGMVHSMLQFESTIFDKILPQFFIRKMHGFVTMADSVIEDINKFDSENKPKLAISHPIYDHYGQALSKKEAAMRLGLHEQKKYILFFGIIQNYKGLELLLEAFSDARLRKFDLKLVVAGEFYENPEPYLNKIIELNLEGLVELRTGFIPDDEVRNYFSISDIVAQPYLSANQSGITQIAYYFDKPMLVTNVGGLSDIVQNGKVGYVVEVNAKSIADALVDFFEKNRYQEFSNNIIHEKEKFSWSNMTTAINTVCHNQIKK